MGVVYLAEHRELKRKLALKVLRPWTPQARGLIHRDVKPANVLVAVDPDGAEHCYLTDFGLTKRPDQTTGLTITGQFMGSVDYAAPEQFEGKPLDARTHVYSLACVAYECLTGEVPFPRDQAPAVVYADLRDSPPQGQRGSAGDSLADRCRRRQGHGEEARSPISERGSPPLDVDFKLASCSDRAARRVHSRETVG